MLSVALPKRVGLSADWLTAHKKVSTADDRLSKLWAIDELRQFEPTAAMQGCYML